MKRLLLIAAILLGAVAARAKSYTFSPNPADLSDLEHQDAYIWGINEPSHLASDLSHGMVITKAEITIKNIWNWNNQANKLFIDLLDNPKHSSSSVRVVSDNPSDNSISDYFATTTSGPNHIWSDIDPLTQWSDPHGGSAHNYNLVFDFNAAQIQFLTSCLTDPRTMYGNTASFDFGLAFDPDCHFYNCGITFEIDTSCKQVPEGGMTAALLGIGFLGLAAISRRLRA